MPLAGCYTMNHKVGNGAQGSSVVEKRQWYVLFGLVPLEEISSHVMANGAKDYDVKTEWTPLDILMNIVTGWLSFYSRTITVTKQSRGGGCSAVGWPPASGSVTEMER